MRLVQHLPTGLGDHIYPVILYPGSDSELRTKSIPLILQSSTHEDTEHSEEARM